MAKVAAALSLALVCGALLGLPGGAAAEKPVAVGSADAAAFVSSIGVQVHLNYNARWGAPHSPYADPARVERALDYLNPAGRGVRVLRETAFYARGAGYLDTMRRLCERGYKWDIYIGYDARQPDWSEQFSIMRELHEAGCLALAEGPLEVDNPGWGLAARALAYRDGDGRSYRGWAAAVAGQRALRDHFRGKVPVALWSLAQPGNGTPESPAVDAARAEDMSVADLADWGNIHFYQHNGDSPGHPEGGELGGTIAEETGYIRGKPFAITETGFNTLNDPATRYFGTPQVNAQYLLTLLLEAFRRGSALTVIYELFDEGMGYSGAAAFEDHWGLFDAQGKPKPAAQALRNMLLLLGETESGQAEEGRPVAPVLHGLPHGGGALMLRKPDGSAVVAIWSGANLFTAGRERTVASSAVRLELPGGPRQITVYDPASSASPIAASQESSFVSLPLADRVLLVALGPPRPVTDAHNRR